MRDLGAGGRGGNVSTETDGVERLLNTTAQG